MNNKMTQAREGELNSDEGQEQSPISIVHKQVNVKLWILEREKSYISNEQENSK